MAQREGCEFAHQAEWHGKRARLLLNLLPLDLGEEAETYFKVIEEHARLAFRWARGCSQN